MLNMTVRLPSKRKFIFWSLCIIGLLIIVGFVIGGGVTAGNFDNISTQVDYARKHGWDVSDRPLSVKTFTVADKFDKNLKLYNEIQQSQGFDLSDYKGCEVKRYTYELKNYPHNPDGMRLSLIIYKGNVIAGDIHSTMDSGFMHGFNLDGTNIAIKQD